MNGIRLIFFKLKVNIKAVTYSHIV